MALLYTAMRSYRPRTDVDPYGRALLQVRVNDLVCVVGPDDRGWSTGYLKQRPERTGLFPSTCIGR